MIRAPISLCMIVKNEPFLETCLRSVRDYVEELVIVDTGSVDETPRVAQKYADLFQVYTDCNDPETGLIEDFSKARNYSLSLATYDKVMWCDGDDIITGMAGLGDFLTKCDNIYTSEHVDCYTIMLPYEYAYDANGKCSCRHYRERIFSNKRFFQFVNPVHEVAVPQPGIKIAFANSDDIVYKHQRQYHPKIVDPSRNLRILKKHVAGPGAGDPRQLYYIGLEYHNNGMIGEAIDNLTKYIEVSGWEDERVMACLKLVDIYQAQAQYQEALKWAFKSIEICETWSEGYLAAGRMFYFLAQNGGPTQFRNWQKCIHFIRAGLALPPTKTLLFINPIERDLEIYKYLNMALNAVGDVKGALESVEEGLKNQPDPSLLFNKKLYENHLAIQQITSSVETLKKNESLDETTAQMIISLTNKQITATDLYQPPKSINTLPIPSWTANGKYDIVFYIGQGMEDWTPATVQETGIGGSELMAIEISKRLAAQGHRVRVYNSCGNGEGVYDGVEYYLTPKYKGVTCDILIVSRWAPAVLEDFQVTARLKLLWVHDVCAIGATPETLSQYDVILALSQWHKQNLIQVHQLDPNKIIVTRNGINLKRFDKKVIRNQYKVVNSSSPDRYLPVLLDVWMEIKTQVPQATLDIFYGFQNWEKVAHNDPNQMAMIHKLKMQMDIMKPFGVTFRDRVNQDVLAEEFLSAGVWASSTWWTETSCITAMEAQAAGLRIVTSSIAALNETVGKRGILIDGEWTSPDYKRKFVDAVVSALQKTDNKDRKALQKYAKNFDLDTLVQEWEQMFITLISNNISTPINDVLIPYDTFRGYKK
jgi:glycosyltransferase involved in cell wall biosynthesis/tetratricopeptide (TPR) repeat protein